MGPSSPGACDSAARTAHSGMSKEDAMKRKGVLKRWASCLILVIGFMPAFAGDVFGGKVTEVRSAEIVVVDYGKGQYVVRLAGVAGLQEGPLAAESKKFVTDMVLGKEVRARFVTRNKSGEMVSRLFVGDPGREVGLELLKAGLARRRPGPDSDFGYKYNELAKAEAEAREKKRGIWATTPPTQPR